jgi:D-glycero-alpha-D-manno-heptose-7-phosphate kinase
LLITRTPLRVSFLGGGTDLTWFSDEHGGQVLSAAINKYVYVSGHPMFDSTRILLKYSESENAEKVSEIRHPIFREVLSFFEMSGFDFSVNADVPSGTGLGSSSSFTVGLLNFAKAHLRTVLSQTELAELACYFEIERLKEPIGKQDQFAAAFGGVHAFEFKKTGQVTAEPFVLRASDQSWLENCLLLIRIGEETRSAGEVLLRQKEVSQEGSAELDALRNLLHLTKEAIPRIRQDIRELPNFVNLGWELKKQSNPGASSPEVEEIIARAMSAGALGCKLLGAGGAGFVLAICDPDNIQRVVSSFPAAKTLRIRPEPRGSSIVYQD